MGDREGVDLCEDCTSTCLRDRESEGNVREMQKNQKGCAMRSCRTPQSLRLCSQERRGVRDGSLRRTLGRGPLHPSSWLASSSPLCLWRSLQAPVSPRWFVSKLLSLTFLSLHRALLPFILFFVPCRPIPPFVPIPPSFSELLMDKLTMAPPLGLASGPSHTSLGCLGFFLQCLAYFHMTPRKLK